MDNGRVLKLLFSYYFLCFSRQIQNIQWRNIPSFIFSRLSFPFNSFFTVFKCIHKYHYSLVWGRGYPKYISCISEVVWGKKMPKKDNDIYVQPLILPQHSQTSWTPGGIPPILMISWSLMLRSPPKMTVLSSCFLVMIFKHLSNCAILSWTWTQIFL